MYGSDAKFRVSTIIDHAAKAATTMNKTQQMSPMIKISILPKLDIYQTTSLGSAMVPITAVAATTAGEAR